MSEIDPTVQAVQDLTREINPASETFKTSKTPADDGSAAGFEDSDGSEDEPPTTRPFPLHVLPRTLQEIVREVTMAAQVPASLAVVPALGILSGSIGAGLQARSGGDRITRANLYLLAIAASATGKGRCTGLLARPFREAEQAAGDRWRREELPQLRARLEVVEGKHKKAKRGALGEPDSLSEEQATRDLADLERKRLDIEQKLEAESGFSVENITSEKLAVSLASQPGEALLSLSAEARGAKDVLTGRYNKGKADDSLYLAGYSGDYCRFDRLNRPPVELRSPCISLAWMIQPDAAAELFEDDGLREGGLLPRFLFTDTNAEAEDEPEEPHAVNPEAMEAWATLINASLVFRSRGNEPVIIDAEDEARSVLRTFTNESKRLTRTGGDLRDVGAFPKRWGEQAWKVALCFHMAEHGDQAGDHALSRETALAAVEAMRWFATEQLTILQRGRVERQEKRVMTLCRKLDDAGGQVTLADLKKRNGFDTDEVERLSQLFPHRFEIQTHKAEGGGRPSRAAVLTRTPNL